MIARIDHFVLTVTDLEAGIDFYTRGLGLEHTVSEEGRHALLFGQNKINLHLVTAMPILPRAEHAMPGSADFCLISDRPLPEVIAHLNVERFLIELGPVDRSGATGPIRSIYLRDPDRNLVEVSEYIP